MSSSKLRPRSISTYDSLGTPRTLSVGRLDTRARYLYTNGHCHLLAIALAKRLDVAVSVACLGRLREVPTPGSVEQARDIRNSWIHAFARIGPDRYLDVMGYTARP